MKKILFFLLLLTGTASAQTVQQSGNVSPNHPACWVTTGLIQDCGVPAVVPYLLASPPYVLTDAATVTPDLSQAVTFVWTLNGTGRAIASPLNLSSANVGQRMTVYFIQGASGSETLSTWGSVYKFSNGSKPTLSTAPAALDRVICDIESTTVLTCTFAANFQ